MNKRKLLTRALNNPVGLTFLELKSLAIAFGFRLARVNGSHHIFEREGIREGLNIQNFKGKAKAYQVRQLLELVETYNLSIED